MLHCQHPGHVKCEEFLKRLGCIGSSVRALAGISHQGSQRLVSYANTSIALAIQGTCSASRGKGCIIR